MRTWLHPVQENRNEIDAIVTARSKKKLLKLIGRNCYRSPNPKDLKKRLLRYGGIRLMGRDFDVMITIGNEWVAIDK